MNEQLIKQMESVLSSKAVVPKVKISRDVGLVTVIVGALITGWTMGDFKTGLVSAVVMAIPVVTQFAAAWIRTDPRMELFKRVLEEMKKNGQ